MLKLYKKLWGKKGFTLIEVVTVTAILAIVAAIGVPSITGFLKTGTITSNDNIARAIFLASQNALTDLHNRGELQTYIKFNDDKSFNELDLNNGFATYNILTKANKLPSKISVDDGDTDNNPYTYFMMLNNDNKTTPLYKLLDAYVSDKGILANNICIEFNAKNGIMKSAFYSDKIPTFKYGGNGEDDILTNRTTTDKIGYYGTKKTGSLPEGGRPVKVALIDGKSSALGEIPNALYVEAYVPNNDDTYTINLMTAEDELGNPLPAYTELMKNGAPFALTFKVQGAEQITANSLSTAVNQTAYVDMKASEHVSGHRVSVMKSEGLYDPFGTGTKDYVKVTWLIDLALDGWSMERHKTLIANMVNPVEIQAKLTCDNTGRHDTSMTKSSHFDSQTGTIGNPSQRFMISTTRHLNNVRYKLDGAYIQISDILVKTYLDDKLEPFAPIGNNLTPFTGEYNAINASGGKIGRYSITRIWMKEIAGGSQTSVYMGLFGVNEGIIENLEIGASHIQYSGTKAGGTGVVAGKNVGTIRNIVIDNCIANSTFGNAGCIAGVNDGGGKPSITKPSGIQQGYGIIENCVITGTEALFSQAYSYSGRNVGGITGLNAEKSVVRYSMISNTTIDGSSAVGGIIGKNSGEVHNVIYNYARGKGSQVQDFRVPIKGAIATTSTIIGENTSTGTLERAISTALTNGEHVNSSENVKYNPMVGSGISDLSDKHCYYLTGIGYNEFASTKLGVPKNFDELSSTAFATVSFGKTEKYTPWAPGPGTTAPADAYAYPMPIHTAKTPENWPIPTAGAGTNGIIISYYEYYNQKEMSRWTPKENDLKNEDSTYVVNEGYGIELYEKDKGSYEVTLSAVASKGAQVGGVKHTFRLTHDIFSNQWWINGSTIPESGIIETSRMINGVNTMYSIIKFTDTMIQSVTNTSPGLAWSNLVKVTITKDSDATKTNLIARENEENNVYIQPLFAKGIYEYGTDKLADTAIQSRDFKFIVRSPKQLWNINYMGDTRQTKTASYIDFKQELNLNLSNELGSPIKHVQMNVIQSGMNSMGSLVAHSANFEGVYDGNGKRIEKLYINTSNSGGSGKVGLFGELSSEFGNIKNVTLVDPIIYSERGIAGALVGSSKGEIENCTIENGKITGRDNVGGIVGQNLKTGEIKNSKVKASKIGYYVLVGTPEIDIGSTDLGGIVGYNEGKIDEVAIENSEIRGMAKGDAGEGNVGGIVGRNFSSGEIKNSTVSGVTNIGEKEYKLNGKALPNIGGIVGQNYGIVDQATVRGTVKIGELEDKDLTYYVGGIAGVNMGNISNAYVIANGSDKITINGTYASGGLVGLNQSKTTAGSSHIGENGPNLVMGSVYIGTINGNMENIGGIVGVDLKGNKLGNIIERSAVVGTRTNPIKIGRQALEGYVTSVGGIVGKSSNAIIQNAFFTVPATMSTSAILGADSRSTNQSAYIAGLVGGEKDSAWNAKDLDNMYFVGIAPKDLGTYYPVVSSDDKIPPGHSKTLKFFYKNGINEDYIAPNNKKMAADYRELRNFIGGSANDLPTETWAYLADAGTNPNVYPYPVLKSTDGRFEGYMKMLVAGDWLE